MNPIEQTITRGRVTYFHAIEHNAERRELTLRCLPNPPAPPVTHSVIFHEVVDLDIEWLDDKRPNPNDIETLIGAESYSNEDVGLVRYVIQTDVRCLIFASRQPPEVIEHA